MDPTAAPTINMQVTPRDRSPERETPKINSPSTIHMHQREPFLAFVPKLAEWGGGIVGQEFQTAKDAVMGFPSWSAGFLKETFSFYHQNPHAFYKEVISGFTVAIMQIPESIAFSFVAGVPPLSGLHATFWLALITGIFGGKPGMISGAAGALAVVVADLTADDGPLEAYTTAERLNVLYMTMFACGIVQILMAWFRLAKVVRLIPETGLIGFMDGLAIIIFMAQLPAFQFCDRDSDEDILFIQCSLEERKWLNFQDHTLELCLGFVHIAISMAILKFWKLVPKIGTVVPASLVGLLVGTLVEHTLFRKAIGAGTRTVEETAPISGSLPEFDWPQIPRGDSTIISSILSFSVTLAIIGGVESVLTLQACNEITDTVPEISDSNQELFAQGLSNLVCGLFRAMGGDAMIGQSTINIMNGARYRVSSAMAGIFMLLFIVVLSPFIKLLPVLTLTGVLFMVVLSTFQWKTFVILRYGRLSDSIAILLVTSIAVFYNLAIAIGVGIVFSALVHAWDSGAHVDADIVMKRMLINDEEKDVKYVHVKGAIFFSSTRKFISMFSVADDPPVVVLDLKDALIVDHSAVAAIQAISHRFEQAGKRVLLTNVGIKSHGRLHRTGDHSKLRRQLTHHSDILDIEKAGTDSEEVDTNKPPPLSPSSSSSEVGEGTGDEPLRASATPHGPHQLTDSVREKRDALNKLAMFDYPVDGVDDEVEVLLKHQGDINIHEKED